ncbi:MAG: response regulator [Verrucomicrobia bacterium]|nr:response regulator [Verrucomicrobiota bacterium]
MGATGPRGVDSPQAAARTTPEGQLAPGGRQSLRFLVIEDMAELAELIVECLKALAFEAEVAATGAAALQLLSSKSFDVVLADIELPDTTGFEVVASASASGWLRNTRIVFCTGRRGEEYRLRAARFPGSSFLRKPYTMSDLMKCIEDSPAVTGSSMIHRPCASRPDR